MMKNVHVQSSPDVYDAIVVGSGITGGWAAKELSEKGLETLVLERGPYVEHGTDYTSEHSRRGSFRCVGSVSGSAVSRAALEMVMPKTKQASIDVEPFRERLVG